MALLAVMAVIFLTGSFLDFVEITIIVIPIVGPVPLAMACPATATWLPGQLFRPPGVRHRSPAVAGAEGEPAGLRASPA